MPDLFSPIAGETLMQYLVRTRPQYEWQDGDGTTEPWATVTPALNSLLPTYRLRARLTSAEFALTTPPLRPLATMDSQPALWPGEDATTPGVPLALEDGLVVQGPLDGVLIDVTGHPSGAGKYGFGDVNSWRYLGAVLFFTDDGHAEWPIQIGPESGIVTPRSMARAASAILRLNPGFTGTLTPWTRTPGV